MSQRRFAVNFFFESMSYEIFLIQDVVDWFERTSMVWGYTKILQRLHVAF